MTNEQIIEAVAREVYGDDEIDDIHRNGEEIPLHTIKGWEKRAYRVKQGEHGIETRLWKIRKQDKKKTEDDKNQNAIIPTKNFYLTKTYLFTTKQVEEDK